MKSTKTRYPRVVAYFNAETSFVRSHLRSTENVLELGASYGRIMKELAPCCKSISGIDISGNNVAFGKKYLREISNTNLIVMDAHKISTEAFEKPFESRAFFVC